MQQSGQINAHCIHPIQSALLLENFTGFIPREFKLLSNLIRPRGQKLIQRRQPLHLSRSIIILGIFLSSEQYP